MIPRRKFKKGPKPTITGEGVLGNSIDDQSQWVKIQREFTKKEKSLLMGACLKVGILAIFQNHCYKFGERLFKQIWGGPTGLRVTGPSAKIRMTRFVRKLISLLTKSGIVTNEIFVYVDDLRLILRLLEAGTVFCQECSKFRSCPTQLEADLQSQESPESRTSRILGQVMNMLEPELRFTTESSSDFQNKKLPTLDYQVWAEDMEHEEQEGTPTTPGERDQHPLLPDPVPLTSTYWEDKGMIHPVGPREQDKNPTPHETVPQPSNKSRVLKYMFF